MCDRGQKPGEALWQPLCGEPSELHGGGRPDFRLLGAERRRQIHHNEYHDRLSGGHGGTGPGGGPRHSGGAGGRPGLHRLSPRDPAAVSRYDGGGVPALLRGAEEDPKGAADGPAGEGPGPDPSGGHERPADPEPVQGLPPAGGPGPGHPGLPQDHYSGRAHRGPGSQAGGGDPGSHPASRQGPHRDPQLPHPL